MLVSPKSESLASKTPWGTHLTPPPIKTVTTNRSFGTGLRKIPNFVCGEK